jgi:hypothetical protein
MRRRRPSDQHSIDSTSERTPEMAQYLILLYGDEAAAAERDEAAQSRLLAAHGAFQEFAGARRLSGNALQPSAAARSVRESGGGFAVTDGPFAETKEALGGYYLVEAADLDEAIELARRVPAPAGGVEVRPIMTFDS